MPAMVKKQKTVKKRRVSFNIPEQAHVEEVTTSVRISVQDNDKDFDDDVETADVEGTCGSDSSSDSSSASDVSGGVSRRDSDDDKVETLASLETKSKTSVSGSEDESPSQEDEEGIEKETDDVSDGSEDSDDDDNDDDNDDNDDADSASDSDSASDEEASSEKPADTTTRPHEVAPAPASSFGEMSLDPRVERAIERAGWRKPTPVQSAVIPAALGGRDVLVSAPTGSGKTAAYAVPIVQHICQTERAEGGGARAVVLVPTRELVHQVAGVFKLLCKYTDGVRVAAVTSRKKRGNVKGKGGKKEVETGGEGPQPISRSADIVVGTPASVLAATGAGDETVLSGVQFVVVDEADLVLSYGYENDSRAALAKIPPSCQSMLLSATLEADGMESFRKIVLRRPLTIKVTTDGDVKDGDPTGASHYFARLKNHRDRYLVTYAMLRLNVVCGKVLIFVNHINSAFRLKLFLDQFKVKSAVLNSELPANSRMHCVDQFNAGIFDILIATDEAKKDDAVETKKEKGEKKGKAKKRKAADHDKEFGLSRGVDFRDVAAVLNFDNPTTLTDYTHRAGRTARAGRSGTVLSLVCCDKEEKEVSGMGRELGVHIGPLAFRMDQIEAFRYRVEDCLRMVTDTAVHGARLSDLRREIVNSEHLQDYFEDNPQDLDALQHNLSLAKNVPEHLAHIPSYLLPPALRGTVTKDPRGSKFRVRRRRGASNRGAGGGKNGGDPLKSFSNRSGSGSSRQRFQEKHGITKKSKGGGSQLMRKRKRTY